MNIFSMGKPSPMIDSVPGETVGAKEVSRRHPGMRKIGKAGESLNVIKHVEDDLVTEGRHYRERKSRVTGKGYGFNISKETPDMSMVGGITGGGFSGDVGMIDESDFLKPSANRISTEKTPIPSARVAVAGEKGLKSFRDLKPGVHIPVSHIPPILSVEPKPVKDEFIDFSVVQKREEDMKLPKPAKAKRAETMVEDDDNVEMFYKKPRATVEEKPMVTEMKEKKKVIRKMMPKMEEVEKVETVKEAVKETGKAKKSPTAYNTFVAKMRKEGKSMTEIGQMWRNR